MLYVTTRNENDAYTAYRAVHEQVGPDGGGFLPFRMPEFTAEEIAALQEMSFGQCVADMLNRFFSCGLTGWDVDFMAGRNAVQLPSLHNRVAVAELWHNAQGEYEYIESVLARQIGGEAPNSWVRIAIRMAVLTGVYGMMLRSGYIAVTQKFDVSVAAEDFSSVMAVWYLRRMGFPVANIICCCNDNSAVWDLLQHGEMKTARSAKKNGDSGVPDQLERLISATLGVKEACRYHEIWNDGRIYAPPAGSLEILRKGMAASVVSSQRLSSAIPNVYSTAGYIMGPYTALGYSGLMDYRAKTGLNRPALLLADRSPLCDNKQVCSAIGWTLQQLREKLI